MIIGKFKLNEDGVYEGLMPTFTSLPVRIKPAEQKGVDYTVALVGEVELGVGWKKTSGKGNEYISIKLDSPFFAAPVNCALVKNSDRIAPVQPQMYALIWDREKPKAEPTTA